MPNKIADNRRRVVYNEEKVVWKIFETAAKYNGIKPSNIIRMATHQMAEWIEQNPKGRLVAPIFDKPMKKFSTTKEKGGVFRVFCPYCEEDHRVPRTSMGSTKQCKGCKSLFVVQEKATKKRC
jgi:hypothetical protein